ncbi:MAG: N-acetylneuraminate synthase NeuB1, partial [uncultured bacterium]
KNAKFMLLHCISQYPTPYEDAHLSFISTMKHLFNCPIGFSDHGEGTLLSETAVALGACIIEKHFTLDKNMDGPDQKLSADIPEFSSMVKNIRNIEKSLGNPYRNPTMSEFKGRHDGRRGIKAGKNLKKGSVIKPEDLKIIKPQTGILPEFYNEILGKKLLMDVDRGNPINWNAVE